MAWRSSRQTDVRSAAGSSHTRLPSETFTLETEESTSLWLAPPPPLPTCLLKVTSCYTCEQLTGLWHMSEVNIKNVNIQQKYIKYTAVVGHFQHIHAHCGGSTTSHNSLWNSHKILSIDFVYMDTNFLSFFVVVGTTFKLTYLSLKHFWMKHNIHLQKQSYKEAGWGGCWVHICTMRDWGLYPEPLWFRQLKLFG